MSDTIISVERISKRYKLGEIGVDSLREAAERLWHRVRGRDPESEMGIVGEARHEAVIGRQLSVNNKDTVNSPQGTDLTSATNNHDLITDNITTRDELWALKDISFEVKRGEVLGIIGRNGAGKSTLLKILSRITEPTSGRAVMRGRVGSLLEVGTGFHPELTGRENIFLNGAILGMRKKEIESKFDEIVAFAEVERFIDTPVKRYSSGMYVRLAFAVAAHLDPEILIVDEVLAVGDAAFQKKCLGKMSDVATREGRTVLFVSHNMAAIQQLCQKGILLSKGQLTYNGTSNDAVNQYINMSDRVVNYLEDGFMDLGQVHDKVHQAKIFKKIRILDKDDKPRETFLLLSPIKIEVELENTENYPGSDYCVAILTPAGQWVTSSATWMYPGEKKKTPRRIVLEIPAIKFAPGMYKIYLSMAQYAAGVYIDKIENAATFYVESIDLFNSGREFTSSCGLVIPDGELSLS